MANLDPSQLQGIINDAANRANIDPALLRALQMQENGAANPNAIGPKPAVGNERAVGLFQILPSVAKAAGVDPTDPVQAANYAATRLASSIQKYDGDIGNAVMQYHGGDNQAIWGPRTRDYLQKVSGNFQRIKQQQSQTGFSTPIDGSWTDSMFNGSPAPAASQAPATWTDSMFANAAPAPKPVPPAASANQTTAQPSAVQQAGSALSRGTRSVIEGLGSGLSMIYDPVAQALNATGLPQALPPSLGGGKPIAPLESQVSALADRMGLAKPQTPQQRIMAQAQKVGTSVIPSLLTGSALSGVANPTARALGQFLGQQQAQQMTGATAAGAAQQAMSELGGGPGWQTAAMLGGALAGAKAPELAESAVNAISTLGKRGATAAPIAGSIPPVEPAAPVPLDGGPSPVSPTPSPVPVPGKPHIKLKTAEGVAQPIAEEPVTAAAPAGLPAPRGMGQLADVSANNTASPQNGLMAERQKVFDVLGLAGDSGPTAGMLSRDPKQWQLENNTSRLANQSGSQFASRYANINQGLRDAAEQIKSGTGGAAQTPFDAMQTVQQTLGQKYDEMQSAIGQQYKAVREAAGDAPMVAPSSLVDTLSRFKDTTGADGVLGSTLRWLKSRDMIQPDSLQYDQANGWRFALNDGAQLSVPQSEELRKLIGNEISGASPSAKMAGRNLIDSLDQDVVNATGNDAFAQARAAARERFAESGTPFMQKVLSDQTDPQSLFRTTAISGDPRNLQALRNALQSGTKDQIGRGKQAWNDVRGQVVDHLIASGFGHDGAGQFNSGAFTRALNQVGMPKLSILFSPSELSTLGNISRVGKLAFQAPNFANPNTSNTAAGVYELLNKGGVGSTIEGLIDKINKVPVLNAVATPVTGIARSGAQGLKETESASALQQALHPDVSALNSALLRKQDSKLKPLLERLPASRLTATMLNALRQGPQK